MPMQPLIDPKNQKFVVVLVAALVSFLGFQAASLALEAYQVVIFLRIAFYVYVFLVLWQMFVFDLHLKKTGSWYVLERSFLSSLRERFSYLKERSHLLHFLNYVLLPTVIYWSTVVFLFLNPFDFLRKQIWLSLSTLVLAIAFWYLKTVFYAHENASRLSREMIFSAKLYASFLAFAAALGSSKYFAPLPAELQMANHNYLELGATWFAVVVASITILLLYQALFQHHYVGLGTLGFLVFSGFFMGILSFGVYYAWNVNFYSGALFLAVIYNTIWGIIHHKYIDKNLTAKILYEYLAVLFVVLVIIFSTTNFAERI